jgi:hypothetical protein
MEADSRDDLAARPSPAAGIPQAAESPPRPVA